MTNAELKQLSPEELQKLVDLGELQFSDIPMSHPYWEWRKEQ